MDKLTELIAGQYPPDPRDARIAELEAMVDTQAATIRALNRLLDGVAVAIVGKTRLFADLPEMREEGKG